MTKETLKSESTLFEKIKRLDDNGNEYWTSRDMAKVLEYSEYRHFIPVIDKSKVACKNSNHNVNDSFRGFPRNDRNR
jgi:DNA-damage-inducible protein D